MRCDECRVGSPLPTIWSSRETSRWARSAHPTRLKYAVSIQKDRSFDSNDFVARLPHLVINVIERVGWAASAHRSIE
jgi:hypothetical protein